MALADRNGLYGVARFHTSAKHNQVKAHIGAEDCSLIVRQQACSPCSGFLISTPMNLRASCCSAHRKLDIRISASSSRVSKCVRLQRLKVQQHSMIWKNFPLV